MKTYIALLRGINVGGKNKLSMQKLARMFIDEGCCDVRTFIQSGNVIFTAERRIAGLVPDRIAKRIQDAFDYRTTVILRTEAELESVVFDNPFLLRGVPEDDLHVLFLVDRPEPAAIRSLDPDRSHPDEFAVQKKEVYLNLPNGAGRTKLTNTYFDSRLATTSTGRNWRTVTKILDLAKARRVTGG